MPVPGWTLPGVFTLGGAQIALKDQGCAIGRRVVFVGTGPLLYLAAVQYVPRRARRWRRCSTPRRSAAKLRALPALAAAARRCWPRGLAYAAAARRAACRCITACAAAHRGRRRARRALRAVRDGQGRASLACDAVALGHGLRPRPSSPTSPVPLRVSIRGSGNGCRVIDADGRASSAGAYTSPATARHPGGRRRPNCRPAGRAALPAPTSAAGPAAEWTALRRAPGPPATLPARARTRPFPGRTAGRGAAGRAVVCRCEADHGRRAARMWPGDRARTSSTARRRSAALGMGRCQGRFCGRRGARSWRMQLGVPVRSGRPAARPGAGEAAADGCRSCRRAPTMDRIAAGVAIVGGGLMGAAPPSSCAGAALGGAAGAGPGRASRPAA